MAALGWLLNLAQKQSPANGEERVEQFERPLRRHRPTYAHSWDWFYLCLLRSDNAGVFAAGKSLSRAAATDPHGTLGLSVLAERPAAAAGPARNRRRRYPRHGSER